jgi:hypothetical protein
MAGKPFDAGMKDVVGDSPEDYARAYTPSPPLEVRMVDADVSTVTAAGDRVLWTRTAAGESLLNIEALGSYDLDAPRMMHLYSTLLGRRHRLPVRSVLLLMRREANSPQFTGEYHFHDPEEQARAAAEGRESLPYTTFRYTVVRLWQEPMERLLRGPLGMVALAGLTDEAAVNVGAAVDAIMARLRQPGQAPASSIAKLEATAYVLMGMRHGDEVLDPLFARYKQMEESSTYQAILRRGREGVLLELIIRQGTLKFKGPPDAETRRVLESFKNDNPRLERLSERLLFVDSWPALLVGA